MDIFGGQIESNGVVKSYALVPKQEAEQHPITQSNR